MDKDPLDRAVAFGQKVIVFSLVLLFLVGCLKSITS